MKVLIVGGGAREHAIAWKLLQDDPTLDIIAAPGNPGIATIARCVNVSATDIAGLLALARAECPDLTVIGPESPLDGGIVDLFVNDRLAIFGPTRSAARIETSKRFAKQIMKRADVPTARASYHTKVETALRAAYAFGAPVVIKASGLAAGKGVVVAVTMAEAERAINEMLTGDSFGAAGRELLVEEYMEGEEMSVFALCRDGQSWLLRGAQDHKRLDAGDFGPNTGGMGAYAPVSLDTPELRDEIQRRIVSPTLAAMQDSGAAFTGLLYVGLMLTVGGPRVVEFNCRFGDPETQTLLPLMSSSLLEPLLAIARGESLANTSPITWRSGASVTTVLAASGYPNTARKGDLIDFPRPVDDVYVFHAGTRLAPGSQPLAPEDPRVVTDGGRVLSITAVAPTLPKAAAMSRDYAASVTFAGRQFRKDIAWRELARIPNAGHA